MLAWHYTISWSPCTVLLYVLMFIRVFIFWGKSNKNTINKYALETNVHVGGVSTESQNIACLS